jgi:hypothetical protein
MLQKIHADFDKIKVTRKYYFLHKYREEYNNLISSLLKGEFIDRLMLRYGNPIDHSEIIKNISQDADHAFLLCSSSVVSRKSIVGWGELFLCKETDAYELRRYILEKYDGQGLGLLLGVALINKGHRQLGKDVFTTVIPDNIKSNHSNKKLMEIFGGEKSIFYKNTTDSGPFQSGFEFNKYFYPKP